MKKSIHRKANKKIVVIIGPTSSGKSDLGIKLAGKFNGEIISADSRQVYRRMDIGTGKVPQDRPNENRMKTNGPRIFEKDSISFDENSSKERKERVSDRNSRKFGYHSGEIRHHLIDVANPKKQFTADDFKKLGEKAIKEILAKNKIPIIVGGTGFYIDVLLGRMSVAEVPPNKKLRKKLGNLEIKKLFEKLKKLDSERSKTVDPKNKRRLIRAIEVAMAFKKAPQLTSKNAAAQNEANYKILWVGIRPPQKDLEKRIKKRLDARLQDGMIKEVERLHKQGVSWKRLDDFGLEYRQISEYLKNQKSKNQTRSDLKKGSRGLTSKFKDSEYYDKLLRETIKYSKRQMTYFKRNSKINWVKNQKEAEKLIKTWVYNVSYETL